MAISSVPPISGSTPNDWFVNSGVQRVPLKNSQGETSPKNCSPSTTRMRTMPAVVSTVIAAHRNSAYVIACSSR